MSRFKYDVYTLIELVENRPCLWDKTMEFYNDKVVKQKAWREVCATLQDGFEEMDKTEQQKIGEIVCGKWQNIRDSFVKSLRKRAGHVTTKKYMYHDNLIFLLKVVEKDCIDPNIVEFLSLGSETPNASDILYNEMFKQEPDVPDASLHREQFFRPPSPKRSKALNAVKREILKAVNEIKTPDDDDAFFISIKPSLQRLSEDEKLEFRIKVLQLIKDIRQRAEYQSVANQH